MNKLFWYCGCAFDLVISAFLMGSFRIDYPVVSIITLLAVNHYFKLREYLVQDKKKSPDTQRRSGRKTSLRRKRQ